MSVLIRALLGMAASKIGLATRAFVAVLLALARRYELVLQVNRDSAADQLKKSYRKLLLKAHPDKGGRKADLQKLQAAKEEWDKALKASTGKAGRPSAPGNGGTLACTSQRKEYRVHAEVVLLTYHGFVDHAQWRRFVSFVEGSCKKWIVDRWGATFEACETDGLHTHLVLQFRHKVDRTARSFCFEGLTPNIKQGDYLGEGVNKKRHQLSVNRGFFYVFADKIGTQREADGRPLPRPRPRPRPGVQARPRARA